MTKQEIINNIINFLNYDNLEYFIGAMRWQYESQESLDLTYETSDDFILNEILIPELNRYEQNYLVKNFLTKDFSQFDISSFISPKDKEIFDNLSSSIKSNLILSMVFLQFDKTLKSSLGVSDYLNADFNEVLSATLPVLQDLSTGRSFEDLSKEEATLFQDFYRAVPNFLNRNFDNLYSLIEEKS